MRARSSTTAVLIYDEPTGDLDPDASVGWSSFLYRIDETGSTIDHRRTRSEMVDKMRRRVIALEDGSSCAMSAVEATGRVSRSSSSWRGDPLDLANSRPRLPRR